MEKNGLHWHFLLVQTHFLVELSVVLVHWASPLIFFGVGAPWNTPVDWQKVFLITSRDWFLRFGVFVSFARHNPIRHNVPNNLPGVLLWILDGARINAYPVDLKLLFLL